MPKFGEQPKNREIFDKNEENIESIKKQISEATASGDMDKVAELASKGKEFNNQKKELKKSNENEAYEEDAKIEDQKEAIEMNKQFDETKAAEEAVKEKARIAEQDRIQAEKEAAQLAALRAKINGESVEAPAENAEQIKTPEEKQYENFKGTLQYEENGEMKSIFHTLRDNPMVMLEAYKKNPKNLHWVSKRLSKDPEFVKQMEALGADVKDGVLKRSWNATNFDEVDMNEKPTRENFEKAKKEAVGYNLARGTRTLEEMGVDKEFARAAIKDNIIADLKNFFGNGTTFNNGEQIKKAMESVGGDMEEIRNDPEVRQAIVENAIPRFCSHISGDRSSAEWVGKLIHNLAETFNVTKDDWDKAMQNPVSGDSVREYYNNRNRY